MSQKYKEREEEYQKSNVVSSITSEKVIDRETVSSQMHNDDLKTYTYKAQQGRKKEKGPGKYCAWILENQIGLVTKFLLLSTLTYIIFPSTQPTARKFVTLAYYRPSTGKYTLGNDDIYFVVFCIIILTGLRALVMQRMLIPFATWAGIRKKKSRVRFAEQAWMLIYYTCSWGVGTYIAYHLGYLLDFHELWTDFPYIKVTGLFKSYYLVQYAFWVQQIFVINIEERRKDHFQMLAHHIITCTLIFISYGLYQMKIGSLILCIMDGVDILLALAKCLKYLGFQILCDVTFGVFIVSWFLLRHVVYLAVCWSIAIEGSTTRGCYSSIDGTKISEDGGNAILHNLLHAFLDPGGVVCSNKRLQGSFIILLLLLQVITIIWFGMILRIAYRVLSGQGSAEDTRSEGEDEDEDEENAKKEAEADAMRKRDHTNVQRSPKPLASTTSYIEEEADVESLYFTRHNPKRHYRKPSARTTGLSIPGHADRKELLGRIGCDKPS